MIYWADFQFCERQSQGFYEQILQRKAPLCRGSLRIAAQLLWLSEFIRSASVSTSGTKTWYIMTCAPRSWVLWPLHQQTEREQRLVYMKIGNNSNADNVKVCQSSLLKGQPSMPTIAICADIKKNNRRKT